MFDLHGLKPGSTASRCIKVSYASASGLSSTVRLYGTTTGALAPHLKFKVTRGTFPGAPPAGAACTGFTAAPTTPLFDGTLATFPTSYGAGVNDTNANWTNGEQAVYKVDVELADTDAAQGAIATHELIVEARNA